MTGLEGLKIGIECCTFHESLGQWYRYGFMHSLEFTESMNYVKGYGFWIPSRAEALQIC